QLRSRRYVRLFFCLSRAVPRCSWLVQPDAWHTRMAHGNGYRRWVAAVACMDTRPGTDQSHRLHDVGLDEIPCTAGWMVDASPGLLAQAGSRLRVGRRVPRMVQGHRGQGRTLATSSHRQIDNMA